MDILFGLICFGVFIYFGIVMIKASKEIAEQMRLREEETRRKREAFLRWYETLPDEQKYLVDQQLAQANSAQAMQALMGLYLMNHLMSHDHHKNFPFQ
jgi:hypothetical protein